MNIFCVLTLAGDISLDPLNEGRLWCGHPANFDKLAIVVTIGRTDVSAFVLSCESHNKDLGRPGNLTSMMMGSRHSMHSDRTEKSQTISDVKNNKNLVTIGEHASLRLKKCNKNKELFGASMIAFMSMHCLLLY